jgi:hypothetical protein
MRSANRRSRPPHPRCALAAASPIAADVNADGALDDQDLVIKLIGDRTAVLDNGGWLVLT